MQFKVDIFCLKDTTTFLYRRLSQEHCLLFFKTLLYIIVLPYRIWKGSTIRLAGLSNQPMIKDEEEFPVSTFFKIVLDTVIMIIPVLAILLPIIVTGVFLSLPNDYFGNNFYYSFINFDLSYLFYERGQDSFDYYRLLPPFILLFYSYLVIPIISWLKELLTIFLEMIHRLEEIEKNTRNSK